MTILITGAAGFIGANFVLDWLAQSDEPVVNLDKLTYAGNLETLASLDGDARHIFVQGDIGDSALVASVLAQHQPRAVINFTAESHVDRSIHSPEDFIQTNIVGTFRLLEAVRAHWNGLALQEKSAFRFLHVSTDEVYGSLGASDPAFTEAHRYEPNSPYSASKTASDHLVRAYHHTYGLPVLSTNCSNNYGPYHFPEKLIPLMIVNALAGEALPVYGDGLQVRDWLYVKDHCSAIREVLARGRVGETYNVGGWNEKPNIEIVHTVCSLLGELVALDFNSTDLCGDFTNPQGLRETVRTDLIVNAAAHTAVDKAESEPDLARRINATAPGVLAEETHKLGAWLVHYSTDYVFDGSGSQPWTEADTPAPLSVYGQTKLEGEQLVAAHCPNHLIFRTSWVYAARGGNFAKTMLRLAQERERLTVIDDQWGAPTGAELLADVTAHAIRQVMNPLQPRTQQAGLYHLAASGETTWHGYAKHVLAQAELAQPAMKIVAREVAAVPTSAFPTPARRPHNSRLNTAKLQTTFGLRLPTWQQGADRMLAP